MQTISRWETSVTYPDIMMLPILARYFRVSVDYLLSTGGIMINTIESERLLVREWREKDAAALFEIKSKSSNFMNYLPIGTADDALDCIKIWMEYQEMHPVILKQTDQLIGVVGLVDVNRYKGYRELEVHLCDEYNNVDYVTQAHQLILDYGFGESGLLTAFTLCGCEEEILKQALNNTGFVYEGTLRNFGRDMSDRMRYSLTKDEFCLNK
jgi:ribosomal-protein-alanine N-acetyltransferase